MKIIPNIGPATRVLYVLAGAGFLALGLWAPWLRSPWSLVLGALGAIVIVEGAVGF